MSNLGLEKFLKKEKIKFSRSKVGDRYVKEKMKKLNYNLGGEQSGHIILGKIRNHWRWFACCIRGFICLKKRKKASELLKVFKPLPQILENVWVRDKNVITKPNCKNSIKKANKIMGKRKNFSTQIWNRTKN